LPQSNPNCDAGKSDTNGYAYGYGYDATGESDANCYSHSHNTSGLANTQCNGDRHGNCINDSKTYADAEVTAYATSSPDSLRA